MTSTVNNETNQSVRTGKGGQPVPHVKVAIIGTGFSGLGVAIRLLENNINDFVLLERAGEVGGTWRDNSYPGSACDVASLLYSFSFAQKSDWSRTYGKQPEIFEYLKDVAGRFGIRPYVKFHHEVLDARWDENVRRWYITTSQGDYTAQLLVAGSGYLSDPAIPNIPGIGDFQGKIMHSSQWDHDYDLEGRRVAVIGTGASAIQFVPEIQPKVGHLDLYQRTAPWVAPKGDKPIKGAHAWALKNVPGYRALRRTYNKNGREILAFFFRRPPLAEKTVGGMAAKHLAKNVTDPELRAQWTPDFTVACKRLLFSNTWYSTIQQENVEVIGGEIGKVTANGIVGSDGREREVDTLILGTGFLPTKRPIADKLYGRGGVKLADAWEAGGMKAYRGTTVAGFPNLFLMQGPNTTIGHSSQALMIEAQIAYLLDAVKTMNKRGLSSVEVSAEAQEQYNQQLAGLLKGTVWDATNCTSWYQDSTGHNPQIWPSTTRHFIRSTKKFDLQSYQVATLAGAETHADVKA